MGNNDIIGRLDGLDRRIIEASQLGLPLTPEPYRALAEELGVDQREVMARMQAMLDTGVIRRMGAIPNHYRLGFHANGMSVWDVADEDVETAGTLIGGLDFVSHCYRRPRHLPLWPYNLFAMVHGRDRDEVMAQVGQIAQALGDRVRTHDVLFSSRILKKTGLRIGSGSQ